MNDAAYEGVQELVSALPADATIALTTFNNVIELGNHVPCAEFNAQAVRKRANGSTSLYDAIVAIIAAETSAADEASTADPVSIVILTDGQDTSSVRTHAEARAAIESARDKGWTVRYVGTNQNAVETATDMGIDPGYALDYGANADNLRGAMRAVTRCVSEEATGQQDTLPFTVAERQRSVMAEDPSLDAAVENAAPPPLPITRQPPLHARRPTGRWVSVCPRSGDIVEYAQDDQVRLDEAYAMLLTGPSTRVDVSVGFGTVALRRGGQHAQSTEAGGRRDVRHVDISGGLLAMDVGCSRGYWSAWLAAEGGERRSALPLQHA